MKGLLSQLEELAWNLPQGPFSQTPDLLGDGEWPAGRDDNWGWACRMGVGALVWPGQARGSSSSLGQKWEGISPSSPKCSLPPSPPHPTRTAAVQHQVSAPGRVPARPLEFHSQHHHPDTEQLPPSLATFIPPSSSVPFISLPRTTPVPPLTLSGKTGIPLTGQWRDCHPLPP